MAGKAKEDKILFCQNYVDDLRHEYEDVISIIQGLSDSTDLEDLNRVKTALEQSQFHEETFINLWEHNEDEDIQNLLKYTFRVRVLHRAAVDNLAKAIEELNEVGSMSNEESNQNSLTTSHLEEAQAILTSTKKTKVTNEALKDTLQHESLEQFLEDQFQSHGEDLDILPSPSSGETLLQTVIDEAERKIGKINEDE